MKCPHNEEVYIKGYFNIFQYYHKNNDSRCTLYRSNFDTIEKEILDKIESWDDRVFVSYEYNISSGIIHKEIFRRLHDIKSKKKLINKLIIFNNLVQDEVVKNDLVKKFGKVFIYNMKWLQTNKLIKVKNDFYQYRNSLSSSTGRMKKLYTDAEKSLLLKDVEVEELNIESISTYQQKGWQVNKSLKSFQTNKLKEDLGKIEI